MDDRVTYSHFSDENGANFHNHQAADPSFYIMSTIVIVFISLIGVILFLCFCYHCFKHAANRPSNGTRHSTAINSGGTEHCIHCNSYHMHGIQNCGSANSSNTTASHYHPTLPFVPNSDGMNFSDYTPDNHGTHSNHHHHGNTTTSQQDTTTTQCDSTPATDTTTTACDFSSSACDFSSSACDFSSSTCDTSTTTCD